MNLKLSEKLGEVVSRLLVELVGVAEDVRLVDFLRPIPCADLFEGHRHGVLPITQEVRDVLDDGVGESSLLALGFSGPKLYDDMRHGFSFTRCWARRGTAHHSLAPASR